MRCWPISRCSENGKATILDRKVFSEGIAGNIRECVNYVLQHIDVRYDITSLERTEVPQYPEPALREAVVNAVMHRDYSDVSGDVMVEIFRDRIMVSNPGGLVPWLRAEDFGKYSRTRNRVIASLLMRTPYAEKMGTGVLRINQALAEAGLQPAEFSFDEYSFSVTFHGSQATTNTAERSSPKSPPKSPPKTSERIVVLMKGNPHISTADIAAELGISKRAVIKHTNRLQEAGRIRHVGPAKGGHWEVGGKC